MKDRITVKICTGTLCYVMGGADLQLIEEQLPAELLDKVDISGTPCLDVCNKADGMRAPFVKVGDLIIPEATAEKIIAAIHQELENV